jgi:hypothetical protein
VTIDATINAHLELVRFLINQGMTVHFKDHPRPNYKLYNSLRDRLDLDQLEYFVDVSHIASSAEMVIELTEPSIVVGFGSTTLFNAYDLYDIPGFCFKTELVAASLNYAPQHVVNVALKVRYIPNVKQLKLIPSDVTSPDLYRAEAKKLFEEHLAKRSNSLEDTIVQRTAERMLILDWPKPSAPAQVLDYVWLEDEMVKRRVKKIRDLDTTQILAPTLAETLQNILGGKIPPGIVKAIKNVEVRIFKIVTFHPYRMRLQEKDKKIEFLNQIVKEKDEQIDILKNKIEILLLDRVAELHQQGELYEKWMQEKERKEGRKEDHLNNSKKANKMAKKLKNYRKFRRSSL